MQHYCSLYVYTVDLNKFIDKLDKRETTNRRHPMKTRKQSSEFNTTVMPTNAPSWAVSTSSNHTSVVSVTVSVVCHYGSYCVFFYM